MRYGSVCSGIGGCAAAWHPLGWETAFFAEIEPFPSAVLKHHYPGVPNAGDFTSIKGDEYGAIELLVGGTPCQSFSVAGLRGGLSDDRGNLALEFLRLAGRTRPRWVVWENVPGVLSSESGRDFGCILGGLAELGYGFAYRVLNAEYFGVPQYRRRVFVVGHLGDWRLAASVLFERHCLAQSAPEDREARAEGQAVYAVKTFNTGSNGHGIQLERSHTIDTVVGQCIVVLRMREGKPGGGKGPLLSKDRSLTITKHCNDQVIFQPAKDSIAIRRLTPRETERLFGYRDDYTLIPYQGKPAGDGVRYKALGNSWAVPVVSWIGRRISEVSAMSIKQQAESMKARVT